MKKLIYVIVLIYLFSCQHTSKNIEQKEAIIYQDDHWRHLAYLIELKNDVAQRSWKDFSENDFYQPIIYYTHKGTFALKPNEHIRHLAEYKEMNPFGNVQRIQLSEKYTDTTNFNFHTSYSDSDSTALYYQENVLFFQSFDLTKKLIGISDLEDWSIMVIHELFHGYQRAVPEFKAYSTSLKIPGGPDQYLAKYYKQLKWFKESVDLENQALKDIWINEDDLVKNLKRYDSLRSARIARIKDTFDVDIREVEDYEIMVEGQARYFESLCKRYLAESYSDTLMLKEKDLHFISNMFDGYKIKEDKGLYTINNDRYYYQLGYNISMILEKYLPTYKETIYVRENNFNHYIEILLADNK